ncbi:lipocalin family protein [Autumnicola psychrophila]|uniref:Lipocalin-like domain-containing protein n=1 Tax=Autumnicola psychrophila TaxID=3075592 RepID=A0ABU3DT21_9FLAO|nr:lipocalin family protein [Zunongwangia sp. F225]MDT0686788.1 hypothetical protein [Zunongwangia sp. F225]
MKKYLLLLAAFGFLFFTSCSDDTDENPGVVGTWVVTNIETVAPVKTNTCDSQSTITFYGDDTLSSSLYIELNNCQEDSAKGTWYNEEGNYFVYLENSGELEGTLRFRNANKISFFTDFVLDDQIIPATFTLERL